MKKVTFEFDEDDIRQQIERVLMSRVKSYATTIGLATFSLAEYVKENEELQKLIKAEVKKRLKDKIFMNKLIRDIVQESIKEKLLK